MKDLFKEIAHSIRRIVKRQTDKIRNELSERICTLESQINNKFVFSNEVTENIEEKILEKVNA